MEGKLVFTMLLFCAVAVIGKSTMEKKGLAQDYGSYGSCNSYNGIQGTCKPTCDDDEVGMAGKEECGELMCCFPGY